MTLSLLPGEIIVDSFAGGGGASTGIYHALGRHPDIAINHWGAALEVHKANHPSTTHYVEDVWKVDPVEACKGRPVGLAWFSPTCTNFSQAKGGALLENKLRGLAWVATRWAKAVRPRILLLENVEHFAGWGPLVDGRPCELRKGKTFKAWLARFKTLGYQVEYRNLVAADYGAPTTRKRLFLIARCDGLPIIWPEPTHGKGRAHPWRSAASIIDWSIPCPSIFGRKKPLAEATLRRIASGLSRFVIDSANPFIIPLTHQGGDRVHDIREPMRTVTAAHRGELALIAPSLVQTGYGERDGQRPRALDIEQPLGTVVAGATKHAVVSAFLAKHFGGPNGNQSPGIDPRSPLSTVTARDHHGLAAVFLSKFYGTSVGEDIRAPLPTVTATGQHLAEVRAFLKKYAEPSSAQASLFGHTSDEPLVKVGGEQYRIVDIGLRMLSPRELFDAQGFPHDYRIDIDVGGKPLTKTAQVTLAGNSVSPPVAEALVRANVGAAAQKRTA